MSVISTVIAKATEIAAKTMKFIKGLFTKVIESKQFEKAVVFTIRVVRTAKIVAKEGDLPKIWAFVRSVSVFGAGLGGWTITSFFGYFFTRTLRPVGIISRFLNYLGWLGLSQVVSNAAGAGMRSLMGEIESIFAMIGKGFDTAASAA